MHPRHGVPLRATSLPHPSAAARRVRPAAGRLPPTRRASPPCERGPRASREAVRERTRRVTRARRTP